MEWLARTAMLVLSALATLALIGSLASVSNSALGDAFPGEVATPPQPVGNISDGFTVGNARGEVAVDPGTGASAVRTGAPPADSGRNEVTRWLKALTYAVLALAAVAAAAVVALVRIGNRISTR